MFAVIKTGGKQYRVAADDKLKVEKVAGEVGDIITFGEVLVVGGDTPTLGTPAVSGAQALAIAQKDAESAYRDLSPYRIQIALEPDGWHVDYELKNQRLHGGGPHYIIDPQSGSIRWKIYERAWFSKSL